VTAGQRRRRDLAVEVGAGTSLLAAAWIVLSGDLGPAWCSVPDMLDAYRRAWLFAHVGDDVVPSLVRLTLGFAAAVVVGVAAGTAIGSSRTVRELSQPVVSFMRSLPAVALLPFSLVLFGIGTGQKVFIIAFVCCWPVMLNTADGIAELDTTMLATARVYRVTGRERLRAIVLPAIGPRVFAGMRTSLSLAILLLVTSEMAAATSGIGFFVWQSQQTFSIPDMWAGILLLGLLGYVLNLAFGALERRVCGWHAHLRGRAS
jgi:ABC-type nitrate/sulfonate/bicarbonate transport system permease component